MSNLQITSSALLLLAAVGCGGPTADPGQPIVVEPPADEQRASAGSDHEVPPAQTDPDTTGSHDLVVGQDICESDDDCVPAACCHAAACTSRANAPSCGDAMCTQECQFGTLDCGGGCLCHEGRCAARLSEPPEGLGAD